jgi:ABC-type Fe3+/spermidine/putrescine transport system ATPase subunit
VQFCDKFVEIESLSVVYPSRGGEITALKDVSLHIGAAEFVSLLGASGCGKSTVVRCVAGLVRPTTGRIGDRQCRFAQQNPSIAFG